MEVAVDYLKLLSRNSFEQTVENHEDSHLRKPVAQTRFELDISWALSLYQPNLLQREIRIHFVTVNREFEETDSETAWPLCVPATGNRF